MIVRTLTVGLCMTISLVGVRALPSQSGTATGSMTVSGKTSTLSHVHAFPKKVFGRPAVLLVFSDIDLTPADAGNDTKLSELGDAGKLHGMGILVADAPDGKKQQAISNEIYDQGFHGRMSIGGEDTFEARQTDGKSSAGRLFLKQKKFESGVTFTYDVTFDTPIER